MTLYAIQPNVFQVVLISCSYYLSSSRKKSSHQEKNLLLTDYYINIWNTLISLFLYKLLVAVVSYHFLILQKIQDMSLEDTTWMQQKCDSKLFLITDFKLFYFKMYQYFCRTFAFLWSCKTHCCKITNRPLIININTFSVFLWMT